MSEVCSTWLDTTNLVETIGFGLCVCSNILLIVLIVTSKVQFGNYKYLMLMFSVMGIVYSSCSFVCKPNVHITSTSFIMFTVLKSSFFNKFYGSILVVIYSSCNAMMLALLTIVFYYRYTSVKAPFLLFSRFSGVSFFYWILLVLIYAALWGAASYFFCGPTVSKDLELEPVFNETYCLDPEEYAYIGPQYYTFVGEKRVVHPDSFIGIGILTLLMATTFCLVTFYGVNTQLVLNDNNNRAYSNKPLQKQLFRTLIIQTMIPLVFLYIPLSIMFLFPIVGWKIDSIANFIPISLAIYPCLEPMVALVFINDFKNRIKAFVFCGRYRSTSVGVISGDLVSIDHIEMQSRALENES